MTRQTLKRWIDLFADYGARLEIVYMLSSHRAPIEPGRRDFNFGFRCVVTVGASSP